MPLTAIKFNFTNLQKDKDIWNEDIFPYHLNGIRQYDMKFVHGDTYKIKEDLKRLGGRWFPDRKLWAVPLDSYPKALEILIKSNNKPSITSTQTNHKGKPWNVW